MSPVAPHPPTSNQGCPGDSCNLSRSSLWKARGAPKVINENQSAAPRSLFPREVMQTRQHRLKERPQEDSDYNCTKGGCVQKQQKPSVIMSLVLFLVNFVPFQGLIQTPLTWSLPVFPLPPDASDLAHLPPSPPAQILGLLPLWHLHINWITEWLWYFKFFSGYRSKKWSL